MPNAVEPIDLSTENAAFSQLTPHYGGMCCEAAAYCFQQNGHSAPTATTLQGCGESSVKLQWEEPTATAAATYGDRDVAAENGAYAVAIAVINRFHGYQVIERSAKGTGFDFWLGNDSSDLPFNGLARLEVSGIFSGSSRVSARLTKKLDQMHPTDTLATGFAVVAEFGAPIVAVKSKGPETSDV